MPDVPIANRGKKAPGNQHEVASEAARDKRPGDLNASKQGGAANISQNATNKGSFGGRRMK